MSSKKNTKKTVSKEEIKSIPSNNLENNNGIESTVSSYLDDDYRDILMRYDVKKNKSRPIITIYERTLLIGKRATQIAYGALPNIEVNPGMSVIQIAEEELKQRKIPLVIKRTIGDHVEYWKPSDMIIL